MFITFKYILHKDQQFNETYPTVYIGIYIYGYTFFYSETMKVRNCVQAQNYYPKSVKM